MTESDYLELIRAAPNRAIAAQSCRVRRGNLDAGPASALVVFEEGISDLARRWTLTHQEMTGLPQPEEGHRVGLVERFARGLTDAITRPKDLLYVDGTVFERDADGRLTSSQAALTDAPRHPNDPMWCLDILSGVRAPVEVRDEGADDAAGRVHLAAIADLSLADRTSPCGVRPGIASRGSERKQVPFHVWLNDGLVERVSTEHVSGYPGGKRFWGATEFSDFGIDVPEAWTADVSRRTAAGL